MKPPFTIAVLADYIAAERFERLPKRVVTKAVHCIQDSVACLLGAYSTRLAGILTGFARERGGPLEAHVLGSRIRTSCTTAAFANALLINALDYDDIVLGHMGATAISAAFASGEKTNAAGKDLIAATVVGYEVSARIGRALLPTSPRKKTHGWGTWQTFGAAAASACLLKLEPDRAVHALAIAGANAPVPSVMKTVYGSCGPNMVKNNFGTAAEVGLTAALLSARGFEGPMDLFEGDTGFWRMIGTDRSDLDAMVEGLGREYEILKVGFKQFPACRVIQSTIETALACVKRHRIDVSSIDRIRVRAVPRACNGPFSNPRPKDMWAAQFSTPYSVAVALRGVEPGPEWFAARTLDDPMVWNLAARVKLIPDRKALARNRRNSSQVPVEVEIEAKGSRFREHLLTARGESSRPLSAKQRLGKFLRLARWRIPEERAAALWDELGRLDRVGSVRELAAGMAKGRAILR